VGTVLAVLWSDPSQPGCDAGPVVITHDGVDGGADRRQLFERIVGACGLDPHDVVEVRISEGGVEIDLVEFDSPDWPLRTVGCCRVGDAGALECRPLSRRLHHDDAPGAQPKIRRTVPPMSSARSSSLSRSVSRNAATASW
jgi:hypothetical protein